MRLAKVRAKEKAQRDRYLRGGDQQFKKRKTSDNKTDESDEEQFVLDDYESENDQKGTRTTASGDLFSAATLELMSKLGMGLTNKIEEDDEVEEETKVRHLDWICESPTDHCRYFSVLEHTLNSHNSSTSYVE